MIKQFELRKAHILRETELREAEVTRILHETELRKAEAERMLNEARKLRSEKKFDGLNVD